MNVLTSLPFGKPAGQFFTPPDIAKSLVSWVVRDPNDTMLDPSCGDGAMLVHHLNSRGVEKEPYSAFVARERAQVPVDNTDFFTWAAETQERFDCAAGNPPFIRYQEFKGTSRDHALKICNDQGVKLSGHSSTWAAFLVATATLLKPGGRMAFVVPSEIGHAPYAVPVLEYLLSRFQKVHVVAIRKKLFPKLSQDCWLLYCDGHGGRTDSVHFSKIEILEPSSQPPNADETVTWNYIKSFWAGRLRPLLLPAYARNLYLDVKANDDTARFSDFARIGIGYITGDNNFFHLKPSLAQSVGIPDRYLTPVIRGGSLPDGDVDESKLQEWRDKDDDCILLALPGEAGLPDPVRAYLDSDAGVLARRAFKCRTRAVWYSVPGIIRPDYFLQYMSGATVRLSRNTANASCSNSLHAVQIKNQLLASDRLGLWQSDFVRLSCELEGHPLGGGVLKLEPKEAGRILFPKPDSSLSRDKDITNALTQIRGWRNLTG